MRDVVIKFNIAGFNELRRCDAVRADLQTRADRIAAAASVSGGVFETNARRGRKRARVSVVTVDWEARHNESTDRVLTRAVDAGR